MQFFETLNLKKMCLTYTKPTPSMTKFDIKTCQLVFLLSLLKKHPTQPKYQKEESEIMNFSNQMHTSFKIK